MMSDSREESSWRLGQDDADDERLQSGVELAAWTGGEDDDDDDDDDERIAMKSRVECNVTKTVLGGGGDETT